MSEAIERDQPFHRRGLASQQALVFLSASSGPLTYCTGRGLPRFGHPSRGQLPPELGAGDIQARRADPRVGGGIKSGLLLRERIQNPPKGTALAPFSSFTASGVLRPVNRAPVETTTTSSSKAPARPPFRRLSVLLVGCMPTPISDTREELRSLTEVGLSDRREHHHRCWSTCYKGFGPSIYRFL